MNSKSILRLKTKDMKLSVFLFLLILILNCHHHPDGHDHPHKNHSERHMHAQNFDELVKSFDSPEREKWQKPKEVIELFQTLHKGKKNSDIKLADLGAGSGYFSFRLIEKDYRVIALDVNDKFINVLQKKQNENPKKALLEIRKSEFSKSNLQKEEVDGVLSINVYHHIENRVEYLKELKSSLKKNGFFMLIDFKEGEIPFGPPPSLKLSKQVILSELREAGFETKIEDSLLPYQSIFINTTK